VRRVLLAVLAALLLAGCGEERGQGEGTASLWITRDRGEEVLLTAEVAAGLTAMQALEREAEVETRFGGRFVQSINGIEGSLARQRDWFYFINGVEADRGAAEYRLHDGDVLWWDFHAWSSAGRARVWVGAFPEPFIHGYDGDRKPTVVLYSPPLDGYVRELARMVDAEFITADWREVPDDHNVLFLEEGARRGFHASFCGGTGSAGDPVCFTLVGDRTLLAQEPERVRFQSQVVPWP
jgi:Domain of unknown function (DUF4430)